MMMMMTRTLIVVLVFCVVLIFLVLYLFLFFSMFFVIWVFVFFFGSFNLLTVYAGETPHRATLTSASRIFRLKRVDRERRLSIH